MAKLTEYPVSIDARGFLRFVSATATGLKVAQFPFVDIYLDRAGKRVGLKLSRKEQPGSFRMLDHEGRHLVFVKGALSEVKLPTKSGRTVVSVEKDMLVLSGKSSKVGKWEFFPCRNSPNIPMASLDSRGTLILDRNCTSTLDIPALDTASADFDSKKKVMTLTLAKSKGDLNIRSIGSHANISLMGTLSSFGLPLPKARMRLVCTLKGKTVSFNLADLARSTR
jgi:hypothetical protein